MAGAFLMQKIFQSTPLMRGETWYDSAVQRHKILISIHSPHARGDKDKKT